MQPEITFGHQQIVTELIRDIVDTVVPVRPGKTPQQVADARNTVVCTVMAYIPRDPIETMMAGQCVIYDHLLRDGAKDLLHGQAEMIKLKARAGILAIRKLFLETQESLHRMRGRAETDIAFARPVPVRQAAPAEDVPAVREPEQEQPVAAAHAPEQQTRKAPQDGHGSVPPAADAACDAQPAGEGAAETPAVPGVGGDAPAFWRGTRPTLEDVAAVQTMFEEAQAVLLDGLDPEAQREIRATMTEATERAMQRWPGLSEAKPRAAQAEEVAVDPEHIPCPA